MGRDQWSLVLATLFGLLGVQLGSSLAHGDWSHALFTLLNLPALLLPQLIVDHWQLRAPRWFVPACTLFLFLSPFLGSTLGFYARFDWWDDLLHLVWGGLAVAAGFVLLQGLRAATDGISRREGRFFTLFAFSFSLMTSVVWELFEFVWDSQFGTDAQQGGWPDTMLDLTTSTLGALLVVLWSYHWLTHHRRLPFSPGVDSRSNP